MWATIQHQLKQKKKAIRPDIQVVRNGIIYEDFKDVSNLSRAPSDELFQLKPPIVGYTGAVSKWFDFELIESTADRLKDINFVFNDVYEHTFFFSDNW